MAQPLITLVRIMPMATLMSNHMTEDEFWDWMDTCPGQWDQWNMRFDNGQIAVIFFVDDDDDDDEA